MSVKQALPTLPVESVVTPQPLVNVTGLPACCRAGDSLLSSSRNSSEPVFPGDLWPMGAERAPSGNFPATCDNDSPPVAVGPAPRLASATQRPQRAALHASTIPSDGSAPSVFDPTREYSSGNVVLFWQPPSIFFAMGTVGVCHRRRFSFLRRAVYGGGKDTPLPRAPCIGTHSVLVGSPTAQTHRPQRSWFRPHN